MTDTEILDELRELFRTYHDTQVVVSPFRAGQWARFIDRERGNRRTETYTNGTSFSDQTVSEFFRTPGPYANWKTEHDLEPSTPFQPFWRCVHHPEAIHNWSDGEGSRCEHGCDKSDLRWYENGTSGCVT